jgi:hypothetical protein
MERSHVGDFAKDSNVAIPEAVEDLLAHHTTGWSRHATLQELRSADHAGMPKRPTHVVIYL